MSFAQWREDGKVVADSESRKTSGDFAASVYLTNDHESFLEQWNRPASPDYRPHLSGTSEANRGDIVVSIVFFSGCTPDESGMCQLDMDVHLTSPDGSTYGEEKNLEVWLNKPAPPKPNLQISRAFFGIEVEEDDPLGTYRFDFVVRDLVADKKIELSRSLEVVAKQATNSPKPTSETAPRTLTQGDPPSLDALSDLMMSFHESPSRAKFDAYQYGVAAHLHEFRAGNLGLITAVFLGRVHAKHGWPLNDLDQLDDHARDIASRTDSPLSAYVHDDSRVDPSKLDVWWMSFFATGDTAYLDKIVEQVRDPKTADDPLVAGAARWSFTSNCRQQSAVLDYARTLLERDPPIPNRDVILSAVTRAETSDN